MKNLIQHINNPLTEFEQEDLFHLLFNNLEDSFLLVDTALNVRLTNEATKNRIKQDLGYDLVEGTSVLLLAPSSRHDALRKLYQEVFAGAAKTTEISIDSSAGKKIYYENIFKPAWNKQGAIIGAIVITRNITQKKNAEIGLIEMEERWRFALEGANQGVWDWNMVSNEIYYSNSYKKLYGFDENELQNSLEEWEKRIHPDDKNKLKEAIANHTKSADPFYETIYRIKDKREQYKWIMARGMIIGKDQTGSQ